MEERLPTCADGINSSSKDQGECPINGETTPGRKSKQSTSRTFIFKARKIITRVHSPCHVNSMTRIL